ncbi:MAG: hypothetical protein GC159_21010 [Phycisphaera sp.]|nr:hypothetical protein [Phycisphaera sp.]
MNCIAHITTLLAQAQADEGGGLLRWLLGVDRIDPTSPDVVLDWQHRVPLWAWALIVIAAVVLAALSYRQMTGNRSGRIVLAAVRTGLLILIVALLAGPMLVLPNEIVEEDHVVMLVDRSKSIGVADVPDPSSPDPLARISRDKQLRDLLDEHADVWKRLGEGHNVAWLGFADRGPTPMGDPRKLTDANGEATALRSAIDESLRRTAGKPVSAVVVWTDGRSSEPIGAETWRKLRQMGVPVYAVPLGSPEQPLDLAIQRIDAPSRAFINDTVPVTVTVQQTGVEGPDAALPPNTVLKLIDTTTQQVLDEQPVSKLGEPVRLLTIPKAAGQATWRVQLSTPQPELITENNAETLEVSLIDRAIRLLYVEGYPRWEYRYLKNLLINEGLRTEKTIDSSIMLISADRTFAQEGTIPLRRLPRTEEEMQPYDVIVIGDVPANFFSADQQRLIHRQVSVHGAGLLWIGGQKWTPTTYAAGPLSPLLPMQGPASTATLSPPIAMQPTPAAEALGVMRLLPNEPQPTAAGEPLVTWPTNLPPLMWAQSIESIKPAAEPLAIDASSGQPLIVRMRDGAGQSLYIATDEVWRWRYGRGDLWGQQYWMQLIRLLSRGRLDTGGADSRASLVVSHRRAAVGDTLVVEVVLRDQALLEQNRPAVEVAVNELRESDATAPTPSGLRTQTSQLLTLTATDKPGHYRGVWTPAAPGRMALTVSTADLADLGLRRVVQVDRLEDEMRYPATDHDALAELASRTGGQVLTPTQLTSLDKILPNRARHTPADIREPLTHSRLAFFVLILLLTGEWVGRRLLGLA